MTKTISFGLLLFTVVLLLASGCNKQPDNRNLTHALYLAGKNKNELKNVLDYYSKNSADSLKYKAACFLIENMRWHYGKTIVPSIQLWDLFVIEDSLVISYLRNPEYYKNTDAFKGYKYSVKKILVNQAIEQSTIGQEFTSDLRNLSESDLIENIDLAFSVKNKMPKSLSTEYFFEYILPYRVNNEPVFPVRKNLYQHFSTIDEIKVTGYDIFKQICFLNKYIKLFNWDWEEEHIQMPDLGFYNIFYWHNKSLTCSHQMAVFSQILRSIGIPVAEVFTPRWRDSNLGHSWCAVPDSNQNLTLFTAVYQNPGDIYLPHSPSMATKLYMRTYAANPESPYFMKMEDEQLPPSFETPCIRDVTSEFIPATDVEIKLTDEMTDHNLCWFSVFIQGKWIPVGWGVVDKNRNTVLFRDIPVGLTGLACSFENRQTTPCSELFTVTNNGIEIIRPDSNSQSLTLTRKYPVKTRLQYFTGDIIGTKIQGANQIDFSDSVTLHVISDTLRPYIQDISFSNNGRFRYYRLYAPSWVLHIAELEFLAEKPSETTLVATPLPVFAKNQPEQNSYYKYSGKIISPNSDSTIFDGNMLTWCDKKWAGLDLGAPQNIKRIRIAPRNANNGIVAGDNYELYYWKDGWLSAGRQQAHYNYLEYENIPSKTLYWLRNLDHGKEEQPFFYVNGKQVFSNQATFDGQ